MRVQRRACMVVVRVCGGRLVVTDGMASARELRCEDENNSLTLEPGTADLARRWTEAMECDMRGRKRFR